MSIVSSKIGSDADLHLFGGEGVLAQVQGLELVVGLEVRPAPHAAVDHMRQPLAMRHLQERNNKVIIMIMIIIIHIDY